MGSFFSGMIGGYSQAMLKKQAQEFATQQKDKETRISILQAALKDPAVLQDPNKVKAISAQIDELTGASKGKGGKSKGGLGSLLEQYAARAGRNLIGHPAPAPGMSQPLDISGAAQTPQQAGDASAQALLAQQNARYRGSLQSWQQANPGQTMPQELRQSAYESAFGIRPASNVLHLLGSNVPASQVPAEAINLDGTPFTVNPSNKALTFRVVQNADGGIVAVANQAKPDAAPTRTDSNASLQAVLDAKATDPSGKPITQDSYPAGTTFTMMRDRYTGKYTAYANQAKPLTPTQMQAQALSAIIGPEPTGAEYDGKQYATPAAAKKAWGQAYNAQAAINKQKSTFGQYYTWYRFWQGTMENNPALLPIAAQMGVKLGVIGQQQADAMATLPSWWPRDSHGTPIGTRSPQWPTTQLRNQGQYSQVVLTALDDFSTKVARLGQQAQLGPVMGRWNDFWTGKIGANDPAYSGLVADRENLTLAWAKAHGVSTDAARQQIGQMIGPQSSPENLLQAIASIRAYAQQYVLEGAGNPASMHNGGTPAKGNAPPKGATAVKDGHKYIFNGTEWVLQGGA